MIKADISNDGSKARFPAPSEPVLSKEMAEQVICEIIDSYLEWFYATFGTDLDPETRLKEIAKKRQHYRADIPRIFQTVMHERRFEWTPQPLRLYVYCKDAGFQIVVVSNSYRDNDVRPWIPEKYK